MSDLERRKFPLSMVLSVVYQARLAEPGKKGHYAFLGYVTGEYVHKQNYGRVSIRA